MRNQHPDPPLPARPGPPDRGASCAARASWLAATALAVGGATATRRHRRPDGSGPDGTDDATGTAADRQRDPRDGDFSDWKVVMILDGTVDDGGWNTAHARGGEAIEETFPGIEVDYVEDIAPGQTATNAFEDAVAPAPTW